MEKKVRRKTADNKSKYKKVLSELFIMCTDENNKPADRISAAKLLLDYIKENDEGNDIKVIFEGIAEEYLM